MGGFKGSFRRATAVVTLCLFALSRPVTPAWAAGSPASAEALLREARQHAQAAMSGDKRAKDQAEKALDKAEDQFEKAAKADRACAECVEGLAASLFLKAFLGIDKNYKKALETATKGLETFPASANLAYYAGYSHFGEKNYADASRLLNRFLMASVGPPDAEASARQLLDTTRKQFLENWYKHQDYYKSDESRVTRFNPATKQNELLLQVTPEYETSLAQQAFVQITSNAKQVQDAELQAYLEQLVNRMVEKSPGPGHIIVYRGLLAFAETEAELAGVLAHELAHNYGHHSARSLVKEYHTKVLAAILAGALTQAIKPQNELVAILPALVTTIGAGLFMRAYSRAEEKEADLYGSHILFNAGYSPTALSAFFTKLYKENPKQPMKLLSTHPPLPDRADYLIDYSEAFPLDKEMKADSEDFQKIRARIAPPRPQKAVLPPLPFGR